MAEILRVLESGRLSPSHAARLFGKVDFLNTTLFGRVGRTGMLALKQRQYECSDRAAWPLTPSLTFSLLCIAEVLAVAPLCETCLKPSNLGTLLLCTDGSREAKRSPQHVVGAVLYEPRLDKLFYTFTPVTEAAVDA